MARLFLVGDKVGFSVPSAGPGCGRSPATVKPATGSALPLERDSTMATPCWARAAERWGGGTGDTHYWGGGRKAFDHRQSTEAMREFATQQLHPVLMRR